MKKLIIIGLTALFILGLAMGCSNDSAVNDAKAYVSFQEGGLSKALSTEVSVPGADTLYWSYDATKIDGGNSYGATVGKAIVPEPGFNATVGPFSVGAWSFTLHGYVDSARTVKVYEGSATATLESTSTTPVAISAKYVGADGTGYYVIDTISVDAAEVAIIDSVSIAISDMSGNAVTSVELALENGSFSQPKAPLDDGIYLFTYSFYDAADNLIVETSSYAVILKGRETVITGSIDPSTSSAAFNIVIVSDSYAKFDNYYYVLVDTPEALSATLEAAAQNTSAEGTYIILDDDIQDVSSLSLMSAKAIAFNSSSVAINLNGHMLSFASGGGISIASGINLSILDTQGTGSVVSDGTPITVASGATFTLEGGSIASSSSSAIATAGNVILKGGSATGTSAINVTSSSAKISVSGGTLSATDPSGSTIVGETPTINVDNSNVTSVKELQSVINLIPAGNETVTIKFANDIVGGGLVVQENRNIVFDLNGYSYTIGNPTVGSAGTETNGLQLLKNSNITIANGSILNGGPCKILIQNYSNLTLDDVVVDATTSMSSIEEYGLYALSNNNGIITITGSTELIADKTEDGTYQMAFDSYYDGIYPSVSVIFDENFSGRVEGRVEQSASENASISIYAGTFAIPDSASMQIIMSNIAPESAETVTVELLDNMAGNGFVVGENVDVAINFNGYSYTIIKTVGSAGTETNGMQLLKGANVYLSGGSLLNSNAVTDSNNPAKVMIQNYANLSLSDMVIDGTTSAIAASGAPYGYYALSTNNGNITISGNTKIIANSDGNGKYYYAIPAYYWPSAGYGNVSVVFDQSFIGEVVGDITISSDGASFTSENISIKINGGGTFKVLEANVAFVDSLKSSGSEAIIESL